MKFPIVKHSIVVAGRKTSVSLEDEFWKAFREIASERHLTLSDLVSDIEAERQQGNHLSLAIRLFVFRQLRDQLVVYRDQVADHQSMKANVIDGVTSLAS